MASHNPPDQSPTLLCEEKGSSNHSTSSKHEDIFVSTQPTSYDRESQPIQAENDLHRGLKARQLSMIALGGAIGTGLVIGSGTGLARAGPVGILLGYSVMGAVCFAVMISLGEMATYLPHKKGFSGYASRFVDPAMGFAVGWNYLFKYLIVTPNNLTAAVLVSQYWTHAVPVTAWICLYILIIVLINFLGVKVFGEIEFWFSLFKIITLTGLIILGLVLDLGGGPNHDIIGFRYWKQSPFAHYIFNNTLGRFLGVWAVFVNALFAYMGSELVGVTFGEAKNPRKTVPATIKRTFWRLLIFYVGSIFVIGLIVPSNDPRLLSANKQSTSAAASPFVVAISVAGIKVLPNIINACILLFVMSAANSDLYIGSRTLYALAAEGKAPAVFMRTNRMGVPYMSLGLCSLFCCLAFLSVSTSSKIVFTYFVNCVTTFGALTWMSILYSHIRFMKALKVQGIERDSLPYKAPFQPYAAWVAFFVTLIVTFFKGFDTFMPWNYKNFITSYFGIPVFGILWVGYKVVYKTRWIPLHEVDLLTGIKEFDDDEKLHDEKELENEGKRSVWKKIWDGA